MKQPNRLNLGQRTKVVNLVASEYPTSDKNDTDFAKYAADKLGFPVFNYTIRAAREACDPPVAQYLTKAPIKAEALLPMQARFDAHATRIDQLQDLIAGLEGRLASIEARIQARQLELVLGKSPAGAAASG